MARATGSTSKTPARRTPRAITSEYVAALLSYAELLYKGGLGPKDVRRPEIVAALIEVGRDVGLPTTMAIKWIAIINGQPSIWGDAALALIRSSGLLADGYPKEWYEGTEGQDDYTACFSVKRIGTAPERVQRFSIADAKRANLWKKKGPWTDYPERQLMWRAKGFACRDEFQDVLCGLIFAEEAMDYPESSGRVSVVAPEPFPEPPKPTATAIAAPRHKDEPESITDEQLDRIKDLRDLACASRGCKGDEDRRAVWLEILAPFGVVSALDFTREIADTFIEQLGKQQDPFTHPPETAPAG